MSLHVYTSRDQIPQNIDFIDKNDAFFDLFTELRNDKMTAKILREIDHAKYSSARTFIPREGNGQDMCWMIIRSMFIFWKIFLMMTAVILL